MNRRQGNPTNERTANRGQNWRHPHGFRPQRYGSSSRLDEASGLAGNRENGATSEERFASRSSGARRYRTASASSDQSFSRGTNYGSGSQNQRDDRPRNNHTRHNQNIDSTNRGRTARPIGFKALEALVDKDPEELLLELSDSKKGIAELISMGLFEDAIVLFIKILRKVTDATFDERKYKVLQMYLDDNFVEQLTKYILFLPLQNMDRKNRNRYFWKNPDEFWNNVIGICQEVSDAIPTFARKILPLILESLNECFPHFEHKHKRHISDQIKENVKKLLEVVDALVKEYEEKQKADMEKKLTNQVEEEPPNDFRHISVYPSSLELVGGVPLFLRQNVVEGPYRDVNHYLDVQFRLLREDFVGPLRTGIASYRSQNQSGERKRVENVKVYKKVRFLNPETVNEQFCIRLRFDFTKKKKNFKYENSKRFMFGSLLCFTLDNFRTIIFGKVAERKVEDLEKGELIVGFDQNIGVQFNVDYLMVECGVYFEPYYHVLNVLQTMNVDNFPMEKYIIRVDSSVEPPQYLTSPICRYTIRGHEFSPLLNWPSTNFYRLNESQSIAFKAALTQEFSIIQGPPGTGKTFLGLKIAKTLIENRRLWYAKTPMLVICYTNHALDQFLEGITEFTGEIVRVGGQSKNEKMKLFNLKNRSRFKMSAAVYQQRNEVQVMLGQIRSITENLKQIEFYHSIRAFDVFEEVVPNFGKTWFRKVQKDDILDWLLSGDEDFTFPDAAGRSSVAEISEGINNLHVEDRNEEDELEESENEDEMDENFENQVDDLFDEVKSVFVPCSIPLVTVSSMNDRIFYLQSAISQLELIEEPTTEQLIFEDQCRLELLVLRRRYDYLNAKLIEGKQRSAVPRQMPQFVNLNQPHKIPPNDRWNLYFYWLDLYKQKLRKRLEALNKEFREVYKAYEELRDVEDTRSMKNALVVGITTTGAARLRSSLQALKSPIVIVEEAAEVLEAHIVSSLTKNCKHLILIGDHQQLKPSTANYSVEKFYKLGISLFERMVINKSQLYTLNVQHRMRPEISSLISPTIYPALEDHSSVNDRPSIKGLDNCLFFINHTHKEAECEGTSKKNFHEASFLIKFAKHLVLNGYKPENITILAAYLGQMFEMQKEKKKHKHVLGDMRIAVLDNYQGEECDIILLSLVRSNSENRIGFLSIENRVCVALSRARNGFYIMGNMDQLCAASQLWQKIRRTLEQQNAIGSELKLRCQVHTDKITYVQKGEDFLQIPEGGCDQKCGADLSCGHKCTSLCHIADRDHNNYRCREVCNKRLCDADARHLCEKMCYQECGPCYYPVPRFLACRHTVNLECHVDPDTYQCVVLVSTTLPCGHVADKPCHRDPQTYRCPHPCEIKVEPCGHACTQNCHIRKDPDHLQYKCTKRCAQYRKDCSLEIDTHLCPKLCYEECDPCLIRVRKKRTICPHVYDVPCSSNVDEIICEKPCIKILPCGHKCKSKCHQPCGKCEVQVEKINSICGHPIKVKCCEEPDRALCNKKCPLKLPCGHNCTKKCNEPCTTRCREIVDCKIQAPCGHSLTRIKCWIAKSDSARQNSATLLKYCTQPCSAQLKCGHRCPGTCGECHQGRVHKRCNEKQACRPCARPCPYKCQHGSCSKRCGDACTPCKEKCTRRCSHQKCTNFCGSICNVPPCEQPCDKKLQCGHPCVGFCGDPCPPKCLICDKEELTTIFFGFEEDEGARFVLLKDCGHIFESVGLDGWMAQDSNKIGFKVCPGCKTPIKTTQRYGNLIKTALADVSKVKNDFYGNLQEIKTMRERLLAKLEDLNETMPIVMRIHCAEVRTFLELIETRLQTDRKGKRQEINKPELKAIESKLQIIEHIIKICLKVDVGESDAYAPQVKFLVKILSRDEDYITDQEIEDIQLELNRLTRMTELSKIKKSPNYRVHVTCNARVRQIAEQIDELLHGATKFCDEDKVIVLLKELSRMVAASIGISDKERREIVQAIGLRQGHWYKCPNGHPYAIGECGGAMEEAVCPECKAKIGGRHHTLTAGNTVATEMDGARFGAWSDAANMANYEL
ncbi:hypothetical protein Zmor_007268 [Zophobas morio]|uniref:RZ-type domain-containing protein n=1 Tax=Zophobas morio TaxID=2755281 RepID=A0AA38J1J1_9CUCU|nr:hypothetical protein Zmor_007268 [Zophobas morio]